MHKAVTVTVLLGGMIVGIYFYVELLSNQWDSRNAELIEPYEKDIEALNRTIEDLRNRIEYLQNENNELRQLKVELQERNEKTVTVSSAATAEPVGDFELTWYNYNSGYTYTGVPPKDDHTVAVDPDVIPLNTWIIIEMPDGTLKKRRTEDTGSAVQGSVIDEYDPASTSELLKRGRTKGVKVYIIGE